MPFDNTKLRDPTVTILPPTPPERGGPTCTASMGMMHRLHWQDAAPSSTFPLEASR
jgi:hypothetical protein